MNDENKMFLFKLINGNIDVHFYLNALILKLHTEIKDKNQR